MTSITINFPDVEVITSILTILAFCWTVYQEYRHKINYKSIKPTKPKDEIERIVEALHNALPNFKK